MGFLIPERWTRGGLVLSKPAGLSNSQVVGDPCVVWDPDIQQWRMFLFYCPPGHAHAVCIGKDANDVAPGCWRLEGPIRFTNSDGYGSAATHKPYIVQDAEHPGRAALVDGRYWMVSVGQHLGRKYIHRAYADKLAGPWTFEPGPLIAPGDGDAWDAKHADAVTGIYFPRREQFVYFYMGYPQHKQPRHLSPMGNAQGVAVQRIGETGATKIGEMFSPSEVPGHWASGWVGGLQVVPGREHRWIGLLNASPTPPNPMPDADITCEEPAPSLGGFAYCDEEFPVTGWRWRDQPIEHVGDIPADAVKTGEGVNLWRHYLLQLPNGTTALFYNSGPYGNEQLFVKYARV